jgi:hypothetical protein
MKYMNTGYYCLNGYDVITKQVSDHHPVVHDGVLFWNIMMQCKARNGHGFNNGFGIIETELEYIRRLFIVACVIAEIVYKDTSIELSFRSNFLN